MLSYWLFPQTYNNLCLNVLEIYPYQYMIEFYSQYMLHSVKRLLVAAKTDAKCDSGYWCSTAVHLALGCNALSSSDSWYWFFGNVGNSNVGNIHIYIFVYRCDEIWLCNNTCPFETYHLTCYGD